MAAQKSTGTSEVEFVCLLMVSERSSHGLYSHNSKGGL